MSSSSSRSNNPHWPAPNTNNWVNKYLVDDRIVGPPPPCKCKPVPNVSKERESWKPDNPGRRFYNCPLSMVSNQCCRFFDWIDPPLSKHYKELIWKLKAEIEDMASSPLATRYEKKIKKEKAKRAEEIEAANNKIKELEVEVAQLKKINKKQFMMFMLAFVVLFLVMKVMV